MDIKFYNILETKSKSKNLGDVQIVKMEGAQTDGILTWFPINFSYAQGTTI